MLRANKLLKAAAIVVACLLLFSRQTQAQMQDGQWSAPRRLSGPGVQNAGQAVMVPDPYGYLHIFWSEENPEDGAKTLQYSVFDGEVWSDPIDIFAAAPGLTIGSYSADIDENGVLHLIWSEGNRGPVYYATAPALQSLSAHYWSTPIQLSVPAFQVELQVRQGIIHLLYTNFYGDEPGVYYSRSSDDGKTWTNSYWLDPDIPLTEAPDVLQFEVDSANGLHASWYYKELTTKGIPGTWIRYAHSLDGGNTWSVPFTIDEVDNANDPGELRLPYPGLIVAGEQVHMIWAGNSNTQREHRFSLDRGVTWSETQRVFGGLAGQALGDGLVVDVLGRIHFFGQIRWPQGVYHAVWDRDRWTTPSMVYLIARTDAEGRNGRYHAHSVRAGIRAGSQLVLTFTDGPNGPLYLMAHTLEDALALPPLPTPSPSPQLIPTLPTPTLVLPDSQVNEGVFSAVGDVPNLGGPFWSGIVAAILLIVVIIIVQLFRGRNKFL